MRRRECDKELIRRKFFLFYPKDVLWLFGTWVNIFSKWWVDKSFLIIPRTMQILWKRRLMKSLNTISFGKTMRTRMFGFQCPLKRKRSREPVEFYLVAWLPGNTLIHFVIVVRTNLSSSHNSYNFSNPSGFRLVRFVCGHSTLHLPLPWRCLLPGCDAISKDGVTGNFESDLISYWRKIKLFIFLEYHKLWRENQISWILEFNRVSVTNSIFYLCGLNSFYMEIDSW